MTRFLASSLSVERDQMSGFTWIWFSAILINEITSWPLTGLRWYLSFVVPSLVLYHSWLESESYVGQSCWMIPAPTTKHWQITRLQMWTERREILQVWQLSKVRRSNNNIKRKLYTGFVSQGSLYIYTSQGSLYTGFVSQGSLYTGFSPKVPRFLNR